MPEIQDNGGDITSGTQNRQLNDDWDSNQDPSEFGDRSSSHLESRGSNSRDASLSSRPCHTEENKTAQDSTVDDERHTSEVALEAQDSLRSLGLHYWRECQALICMKCVKEPPQNYNRWAPTRLSRQDVRPHLARFHRTPSYHSGEYDDMLNRFLPAMYGLAKTPAEFKNPTPGLRERPFLERPVSGWQCSCGVFSQSYSWFQSSPHHDSNHHGVAHERVQCVDGIYFAIGDGDNKELDFELKLAAVTEDVGGVWTKKDYKTDCTVPWEWLTLVPEWSAVVCSACDERPLLFKDTLTRHVESIHNNDEEARIYAASLLASRLITDISKASLPSGYHSSKDFLLPPSSGWSCSSKECDVVSDSVFNISTHERDSHNFSRSRKLMTMGPDVLVQFVTIANERVFITVDTIASTAPSAEVAAVLSTISNKIGSLSTSIAQLVPSKPENAHEQKGKSPMPIFDDDTSITSQLLRKEMEERSEWHKRDSDGPLASSSTSTKQAAALLDDTVSLSSRLSGSALEVDSDSQSVASGVTTTYRSLLKGPLLPCDDFHNSRQRRDLLAHMWERYRESDLDALRPEVAMKMCRDMALQTGEDSVRAFRRFDVAIIQALLWLQHKLVLTEESMSRGEFTPSSMRYLVKNLEDYTSLCTSYKALLAMKQPSEQESRKVGRLLATTLHEPRYWYAADALDLVDLSTGVTNSFGSPNDSPDRLRKFLQLRVPSGLLDREGKERRKLDDIEKSRTPLSSGMEKIIEAHRRHGRHISPAVDTLARVIFAFTGGLFLLAPMAIMSYMHKKEYIIIVTVAFTVLVSIMLGLISKATNQELLGATAAYAAVLVVFVGNAIQFEAEPAS